MVQVTAAAWILSLAWEFSYAVGAAEKEKTKQKTMNSQINCLKIHFLKLLVSKLMILHCLNIYNLVF